MRVRHPKQTFANYLHEDRAVPESKMQEEVNRRNETVKKRPCAVVNKSEIVCYKRLWKAATLKEPCYR